MTQTNHHEFLWTRGGLISLEIILERKKSSSVTREKKRYADKLHNYILCRDNALVSDIGDCHICMLSLQSERVLAFHWSRVHKDISSVDNYSMVTFYMALSGVQPNYKRNFVMDKRDPLVQEVFKPKDPSEVVLFSRLEPAMERLTNILRILLSTRQEDAALWSCLLEAFPVPTPRGEGSSASHRVNELLSNEDDTVVQRDSVDNVPDGSGTEEVQ